MKSCVHDVPPNARVYKSSLLCRNVCDAQHKIIEVCCGASEHISGARPGHGATLELIAKALVVLQAMPAYDAIAEDAACSGTDRHPYFLGF